MIRPTDKELSLMAAIGDGEYGSALPDDDESLATLTRCVELCWVISEPSRVDDFFSLSPHGRETFMRWTQPLKEHSSC